MRRPILFLSLRVNLFEQHHIVRELGNQSRRKFGNTYLVENKIDNSLAVVKVITKTDKNQHVVSHLRDEMNFNFSFNGLPKVLDSEESKTEVKLMLEYKEGITIDQYWNKLKKKNRLPFLITFFEKLSPIFEHLNSHKIVHCDIKPSNVLIAEKSNDFDVHLIDFGLALKTDSSNQRPLLFPLGYAAPELLLNHLDIINHSTDLFSLANLIWRLYADQMPLVHRNPSIFTNLQLTHPLPEHSAISKSMFKLLSKMSVKHQFRLPPNKMKKEDVRYHLMEAMNLRYQEIDVIVSDLKKIKLPFYQIISLR